VHVIGDACIADAMPKAASAALSQAKQCAAAIVARFSNREAPVPALDSVCYSALALDRSLAIHARFRVEREHFVAEPAAADAPAAVSAEERAASAAWYRAIRRSAFGV
jgi:sulfide dehydrogenase [flavocytochrome c] flavoprotein subunit